MQCFLASDNYVSYTQYNYIISLHAVSSPTVTISPSGPIQGAVGSSSQVINCTVTEVFGVESSAAMIGWMGPNGDIMNNSRTMIMDTTISNDETTYTSTLQFTYLMEGDDGTYTCNFMADGISISQSVELQSLSSKLSFTSYFCI